MHHGPQHRFFERLGTAIKERHVLPGFYHDTFGEKERAVAVDKARSFILTRFAESLNRPSLRAADRIGFTRDEADALASPLPPLSPRGLFWAIARQNMAIGGFFSERLRNDEGMVESPASVGAVSIPHILRGGCRRVWRRRSQSEPTSHAVTKSRGGRRLLFRGG